MRGLNANAVHFVTARVRNGLPVQNETMERWLRNAQWNMANVEMPQLPPMPIFMQSLHEAFLTLLQQTGRWKAEGLNRRSLRATRYQISKGRSFSDISKVRWLIKAGWDMALVDVPVEEPPPTHMQTVQEAFLSLVQRPVRWKAMGLSRNVLQDFRRAVKNGTPVKEHIMTRWLLLADWNMRLVAKPAPQSLPLKKAFDNLLGTSGFWHILGMKRQRALNTRVVVRKGNYPSANLMRTWLAKAGWKRVRKEQWTRTNADMSVLKLPLAEAYGPTLWIPDVWFSIGVPKQNVMNRRVFVKKGIYPREKAMREALSLTGWKFVNEEIWRK